MRAGSWRAPPGIERGPGGGLGDNGLGNGNGLIINRFGDPAQLLAELRELNRRRARTTALLRRVHALGSRPTVELLFELAARLDGFAMLEVLAERFAKFDPAFLRERVGHDFPAGPIRAMPR
jgi:hypothetical protein